MVVVIWYHSDNARGSGWQCCAACTDQIQRGKDGYVCGTENHRET